VTLLAFWIGWANGNLPLARTLAFVILSLAELFIFFDVVSADRSMFSARIWKNAWTIIPTILLLVQLALLFIPFVQQIFKTVALSWQTLLLGFVICCIMLLTAELRKLFFHHIFYK
jgi:Ca2+-transporting ATPase